eukprot:RCo015805
MASSCCERKSTLCPLVPSPGGHLRVQVRPDGEEGAISYAETLVATPRNRNTKWWQCQCKVPIWSLFLAISTASLVVIGAVVFLLTRLGGVAAIDSVGVSYRSLTCTVVENEVVSFLGAMQASTQQLVDYLLHSNISPSNPTSEFIRLNMFTIFRSDPRGVTSVLYGFPLLVNLLVNPSNGGLYWGFRSNVTGYRGLAWPATNRSDPSDGLTLDWEWQLRQSEGTVSVSNFNSTLRPWYKAAVSSSSAIVFAPVYSSLLTNNITTLAVPVVGAVRDRNTGVVRLVASSECTLNTFDEFLKKVSSTLFPGTVIYVVEISTGFLLVSSVQQEVLSLNFTVSGVAERIAAVNARDAVVRSLSVGIVAAQGSVGWAAFRENGAQEDSTFFVSGYFVNVRRINVPGLEWALVVGTSSSQWLKKINAEVPYTVGMVALCIAGTCVLMIVLVRLLTHPLNHLVEEMERLRRMEDLNQCHRISFFAEIGDMQRTTHSLEDALLVFQKYLPPTVVKVLLRSSRLHGLGMKPAEVSIHFSDIVDFTAIAETLSYVKFMELVSEYMQEMSTILLSTGGTIDKFIGDSIMCFWNAPDRVAESSWCAVDAAVRCQHRLALLRQGWASAGLPALRCRIGLHCGTVLVGNFGCVEKMDYTIIGDPVNLASRLEGLNKKFGTSLIISDQIYKSDDVSSRFVCRLLGRVAVKGKTQ